MRLKKLSLLLALTLLVSVSALPVTAHAGGSKDTTPPTLTASLEGDALKIESSDDLSGVEAVFVDENRINSLTDGKASVALKDYTGCPVCKNDLSGCKGKEKPTETEKPAEPEKPKKETGSVGTILFILAALLAVGGIGYYVKIVRPKQQAEDDAEFEDDGYGEGFDPDEAYGEPEYLSEDDFDDKDSK